MDTINARSLYEQGTDHQFANSEVLLGPWTSFSLMTDPKHMAFVLSRYKFCAKMLTKYDGKKRNVIEVGCGDGFGLPILADISEHVWAVDWDQRLLDSIQKRLPFLKNVDYRHVDFNEQTCDFEGKVDSVIAIDVIEHIDPSGEDMFMQNIVKCITEKETGMMILGTPNITAGEYASSQSKIQHINLKSIKTLYELMSKYFYNVFMFGMNDEVVHTGYAPMCHYIWGIGVGVK